jgi:DNA-binding transcriptional MerR regulator
MEYSIGEFSRIARLSVKALRFYHEQGLLPPSRVDGETGYRYYGDASLPRAETIRWLRGLDFSIHEIKDVMASDGGGNLASILERKAEHYRRAKRQIDHLLAREKEIALLTPKRAIEEKTLADMQIAGLRFRGRYDEVGVKLGILGRLAVRVIQGGPFTLYHDADFKEEDADIEVAFPIRAPLHADGVSCRILPGGRAVALQHRGPLLEIGRAYRRIFDHLREKDLHPSLPSREVYLKGPGMLFPGNPKNYVTEVQVVER